MRKYVNSSGGIKKIRPQNKIAISMWDKIFFSKRCTYDIYMSSIFLMINCYICLDTFFYFQWDFQWRSQVVSKVIKMVRYIAAAAIVWKNAINLTQGEKFCRFSIPILTLKRKFQSNENRPQDTIWWQFSICWANWNNFEFFEWF